MSAVLQRAEEAPVEVSHDALMAQYMDTLSFIERLHRLLLDVIKDEFERLDVIDVTSVQALLLFNIGDNEVTAGDHERCSIDRRAVRIKLTPSGVKVREIVNDLWTSHVESFSNDGVMSLDELTAMENSMRKLERFWTERIRYIY